MRSNEQSRESVINPWVSLSDAVLGFMIIIFLLFSLNVIKLKKLAEYVQTAEQDRDELLQSMKDKNLDNFINGKKIMLPGDDIWDSGDTKWEEIKGDYKQKIDDFGMVLQEFMDKDSTRCKDYIIVIVGHASAQGDEEETDYLSLKRAETIRDEFRSKFFTNKNSGRTLSSGRYLEPQDKYKIYATGVGEKQIRDINDPEGHLNRFVEIVLIPDFLKFSQ